MCGKLVNYRKFLKLNQSEMAKIAGICLTSYVAKETGKRAFNQIEMFKIYSYLKDQLPEITVEELFFIN